jgi:hypothetical protein
MTWKNTLAQIKKEIKEEPVLPARSIPKPKPQSALENRSIEEEDALFMAVMGGGTRPVRNDPKVVSPAIRAEVEGEPFESTGSDFDEAMTGLKGITPLKASPVVTSLKSKPIEPPGPAEPSTDVEIKGDLVDPPILGIEEADQPADAVGAPSRRGPQLIHLAAGMAVEVDGTLDLRGHTVQDAEERLRERIQDAAFLGWRTLHVVLGPEEELRDMFLACLLLPKSSHIARYAKAPIPMGGDQAWVLYFLHPNQ